MNRSLQFEITSKIGGKNSWYLKPSGTLKFSTFIVSGKTCILTAILHLGFMATKRKSDPQRCPWGDAPWWGGQVCVSFPWVLPLEIPHHHSNGNWQPMEGKLTLASPARAGNGNESVYHTNRRQEQSATPTPNSPKMTGWSQAARTWPTCGSLEVAPVTT
jgi:hypothetical protein